MVDFNLINELDISEDETNLLIDSALNEMQTTDGLEGLLENMADSFNKGAILQGTVIGFAGDDAVIDVGYKSEGLVNKNEFDDFDAISVGDKFEVLLEGLDTTLGTIMVSKRKADRIRGWERIIEINNEGDTVTGKVMRKIKGGLLVDIGVPVFLPASQVDVRRPGDIGEFIGTEIRAKILKIDTQRRNIVISRRKLVEEERTEAREQLLSSINVGDIIKGTVKNIADFGAFIDLGGIDGLLHITDMSWGRINHPSEIVSIDQNIDIKVLNIDSEKGKVSLGLKQIEPNPWDDIEARFPIGSRVTGSVVNLMAYGAFIKLGEGIEGLVHISEMSWTRRINHPADLVSIGEDIEVVVLDINREKQEISLGVKQIEVNPWELVAEKYPPGTVVTGKVRNMANYGVFIEIEPGIDGMLHVSDLSWTKKITHPNELLHKGEDIKCIVLEVDQSKQRISLGLKQLTEDPWLEAIPTHYQPGMIVQGNVTKITNFGVFVELEDDLEGLLHISELSDEKVENPQDIVKPNEKLEVKILRVDIEDRKIGLSLKRAIWTSDTTTDTSAKNDTDPLATRSVTGGMGHHSDIMGTDKIVFGVGGAKTEETDNTTDKDNTEENITEENTTEESADN